MGTGKLNIQVIVMLHLIRLIRGLDLGGDHSIIANRYSEIKCAGDDPDAEPDEGQHEKAHSELFEAFNNERQSCGDVLGESHCARGRKLKKKGNCRKCGGRGHWAKECPAPSIMSQMMSQKMFLVLLA